MLGAQSGLARGRRAGVWPNKAKAGSLQRSACRVNTREGCLPQQGGRQGPQGVARRHTTAAAQPTRTLPSDSYDYIIVGGGLAGCLLANRLSADPAKQVLLLEAGEDNGDTVVKAPAGITQLFKHPYYDWNLQDAAKEYIARGKLLGGSSSTNATLYHRGTAQDYDNWQLPGWSSKDVLPWFKAAEDNPAFGPTQWHGTGGAMHVEKPIYQNKLFDAHFQACKEIGMQPNNDFNDWSHSQEGYGEFQVSITSRGRRADAYRQYLKPVLGRDNLTVVTRAQTSRVLMEKRGSTPVATGVEVQSVLPGARTLPSGKSSVARVKEGGEVILAAGAVHTPQILMLSGVGPASHLRDVGVDVVADSPGVGDNLQDHPACLSAFELKESASALAITDELYHHGKATLKKRQMLNWALFGKGPLTSTGCDRGAFVRTNESKAQPDLQLRFVAACALNPNGVSSFAEFGRMKDGGEVNKWPSGITFQVIACRPESRGSIRLAGLSISDPPRIDLGYLSDRKGADAATLREGLRLTRKLTDTAAWRQLESEMHPGAEKTSDADLDAYIGDTLHSANAIVGTCAMGPAGQGVVSPEDLTVHGVRGLRVVDASVMPQIPGGQTGAPTVMVAERAAALMTQGERSVHGAQPQMAVAA